MNSKFIKLKNRPQKAAVLKDVSFNLDKEQYNSKLRQHTKKFTKYLEFDTVLIEQHWLKVLDSKEHKGEPPQLELGNYRHSNMFCNYDSVIKRVANKWEGEYPVFSRDIISAIKNKTNTKLLDIILKVSREYYITNKNN
jgi:hypothetical protein